MKKLIIYLMLAMFCPASMMAQSAMTDEQVMQFAAKEHEAGTSNAQIVTKLIQRGVDIQQIRRVRSKYERQIKQSGLGNMADKTQADVESRMRKNNGKTKEYDNEDNLKRGATTTNRIQSNTGWQQGYDENGEEFLSIQTELEQILPADTAQLVKQLLAEREKSKRQVFGRNIFNNKNLTFEPSMNIATPQNYRLGPGDAVIIDVYGASQKSINSTVSPDGDIVIEGFGPIQVSGLTVSEANARIRSQLGTRYTSSRIKISLGQTRTITVNVMGEVKAPGTYTLSAFSTVFQALYMAGGTNDIGTLRNIKIYRSNRLVSVCDIYDYILNGKMTGNVRLADGDVIVVGPYDCLVNISGKVKRPMYYEMKKNESVGTLLKYSGGFTGDAYKKSVRLNRKTGREYSVFNIGEFDMNSFHVADGDSVSVDSILPRYANTVEIKGAVFRPGMYNLSGEINSVRSLIEHAEGLTEEAFSAHAVMHRMKSDRTLEVVPVDVAGILSGNVADIPLKENDVLFIPTKTERMTQRTIIIHGEVQYPGIYKYADNETIEDFILQAGGLTDRASTVKVDVARRVDNPKAFTTDSIIAKTYTLSLKDGFVIDGTPGFKLMPFDEVYVRKSPGYVTQQNVTIEGQAMFAGTYTLSNKNEKLSDLVRKAGGVTDLAYVKGARLERRITPEERLKMQTVMKLLQAQAGEKDSIDVSKQQLGDTYYVGIELDKALEKPNGDADLVLREGDKLIIPEYNGTVKISGDVVYPNAVAYEKGKKASYYIDQAGGWGNRAKKSRAIIVYMNGTVAKISHNAKVLPGSEIIVPSKPKPTGNTLGQWLTIGTSVASIATMIATIANLIKK
ncbi:MULTISPECIES: SLBB domain-containing protein [Prevotellaceae]|uniref:SLBB domain-containing protein n=1 Tax=Prevotellaceae TaxID=171552 RepID=UPI0018A87EB8|nr:SLBB domain-containing protein [Prevotella phocaeensis]